MNCAVIINEGRWYVSLCREVVRLNDVKCRYSRVVVVVALRAVKRRGPRLMGTVKNLNKKVNCYKSAYKYLAKDTYTVKCFLKGLTPRRGRSTRVGPTMRRLCR